MLQPLTFRQLCPCARNFPLLPLTPSFSSLIFFMPRFSPWTLSAIWRGWQQFWQPFSTTTPRCAGVTHLHTLASASWKDLVHSISPALFMIFRLPPSPLFFWGFHGQGQWETASTSSIDKFMLQFQMEANTGSTDHAVLCIQWSTTLIQFQIPQSKLALNATIDQALLTYTQPLYQLVSLSSAVFFYTMNNNLPGMFKLSGCAYVENLRPLPGKPCMVVLDVYFQGLPKDTNDNIVCSLRFFKGKEALLIANSLYDVITSVTSLFSLHILTFLIAPFSWFVGHRL